jgi:hypothetical protein
MSNMKSSFKARDQDIRTIFTCAICYFVISCRPSAPFCHKRRAKNAISARDQFDKYLASSSFFGWGK